MRSSKRECNWSNPMSFAAGTICKDSCAKPNNRPSRSRGDLQREASAFQPLLEANALEPAEAEKLRDLLSEAAALTDGQPPPERLPGLIDESFPRLEEAFNRVKGRQVRINDQCNELLERGKILEKELESLRRTGKASYRREVERMRDLLAPLIGARPPLLCELLEIPDERWQD